MCKRFLQIFISIFALAVPIFVSADTNASLSFSPATGSYAVGSTFQVAVIVGSPTDALNAVSGTVSFPADKLQVVSLSKQGTIMNLWVQEPSFSNTSGTVSLEGVVLNPGYKGTGAKVLTISFRVRAVGSATVHFSNGSILANDGEGTEITSVLRNADFALVPAPSQPVKVTPVTAAVETVEPPMVIDYTREVEEGQNFTANGTAPLGSSVTIFIKRNGDIIETADTKTGVSGSFSFVVPNKFTSGLYTFTTRAMNDRGTKSSDSGFLSFSVHPKEALKTVGPIISTTAAAVLIGVICFLIAFVLWYPFHTFKILKHHLRERVKRSERVLDKKFEALRDDIGDEVALLGKSGKSSLSKEEAIIVKHLEKDFTEAETSIKKEMQEVEDTLS